MSIIIPAYNHEKYVLKVLESVLEDSYQNKELVIIDDGSTDNTNNVITIWVENNITKLNIKYKSRDNRGVSKTLNELVVMSEGEYICIVASDDCLLNGGIAKRVEYLQQSIAKMAVFGDCSIIDNQSRLLYKSALKDYYKVDIVKYVDSDSLRKQIISKWSIPGPVLMVRKIFLQNNKYNESLVVEDWDMYLKLVSKNLLGFIDYEVSSYRLHESNVSLKSLNKVLADRFLTIIINIGNFNLIDKIRLINVGFSLVYIYCFRILLNIKNKLKVS